MKKILTILFLLFLISCETVPVSERKQLILLPDSYICLLYTSPSPRDRQKSRMPSSA